MLVSFGELTFSWLKVCLRTGPLISSVTVDLVIFKVTSSACSGNKLCVLSSQLMAEQSNGKTPVWGSRAGPSIGSSSLTDFVLSLFSILAGSPCAAYSCVPPHLWDISHILEGLDRVAIPLHTWYFPTSCVFYVSLWRQWHTLEPCLLASRTLAHYVGHNSTCGIVLAFDENGQPSYGPTWYGP